MFNYDNFVTIALLVRTVDPFTTHDYFTVSEEQEDLEPALENILRLCSDVKADVLVQEHNLIINVSNDEGTYKVRYRSTTSR